MSSVELAENQLNIPDEYTFLTQRFLATYFNPARYGYQATSGQHINERIAPDFYVARFYGVVPNGFSGTFEPVTFQLADDPTTSEEHIAHLLPVDDFNFSLMMALNSQLRHASTDEARDALLRHHDGSFDPFRLGEPRPIGMFVQGIHHDGTPIPPDLYAGPGVSMDAACVLLDSFLPFNLRARD